MSINKSTYPTIQILAGGVIGVVIIGVILWSNVLASDNRPRESISEATVEAAEVRENSYSEFELNSLVAGEDMAEPTMNDLLNSGTNMGENPFIAGHTAPERNGSPARLLIPSIAVNAPIEQVGLTQQGAMDVPKRPRNAGWLNFGARPGEVGSAVIAGHVDWVGGAPAVFANLSKVKIGDKITVQNDLGQTSVFVIRETRTYEASATATEVFVSTDGKSHLNLITCVGEWDKKAQQYSQRLVVFADLEE